MERMMLSSNTIMAIKDIANFQTFSSLEQAVVIEFIDKHVEGRLARIKRRTESKDISNQRQFVSPYIICDTRRLNSEYRKPLNFAVKLHKLITESKNLISWNFGEIHILRPVNKLEEVLSNYFRHSKFTSFQRQLNNFGFRKRFGASTPSVSVYSRFDMMGLSVDELLCLRALTAESSPFASGSDDLPLLEEPSDSRQDWALDLEWGEVFVDGGWDSNLGPMVQ